MRDQDVGEVEGVTTRPNGLQIGRVRGPLGVSGAVYESRPNVTVDIASICLKSGNAVVLRSGSDAHETSSMLAAIAVRAAEAAGATPRDIPKIAVSIRDDETRKFVNDAWPDMFPDEDDRPARHTQAVNINPRYHVQIEFTAVLDGA